jgi:hypothetical protein
MINFRFHIVSLIAVFLALGLGILVGSTVVDQVIVDRLDTEIKSVRNESSDRANENNALREQNSKLQEFLKKSSAYAVDDRLAATPVAIVAEKGVDPGATKALLDTLHAAGARVPGVLWLDTRWKLDSPKDLRALQTAMRSRSGAEALRASALTSLAERLSQPPPATGRRSPRDVLTALRTAGFLRLSDGKAARLADFPVRPGRVLVVTGTDSELAQTTTLVDLVKGLMSADVPTVVSEVYVDHGATSAPRGAAVKPVRDDSRMAKQVSTLDDADRPEGDVAAVIALQQVADGTVGHYGYGADADAPLPPLPS